MMDMRTARSVQWCDARDITADGHTKGSLERDLSLRVAAGTHTFKRELKTCTPNWAPPSMVGPGSWRAGRVIIFGVETR
eukprot:1709778-Pyramimonas_sp.AAC.2